MPLLAVIADSAGAGKTGVAAAVARQLAYAGRPVWLARGESTDVATSAAEDARWFATLDFAPGSAATPVATTALPKASGDEIIVAELDVAVAEAAATVLVTRELPAEERVAELRPAAIVALDLAASRSD